MSMNGIDISNWQKGINLITVPCDFVIMKATEGTRYVSQDFQRQYEQAKASLDCAVCKYESNPAALQTESLVRIRGMP